MKLKLIHTRRSVPQLTGNHTEPPAADGAAIRAQPVRLPPARTTCYRGSDVSNLRETSQFFPDRVPHAA